MDLDKSPPAEPKGFRLIFRALYHRNYRLFFRRSRYLSDRHLDATDCHGLAGLSDD